MAPLSQKIILALDVETLKEAEHFVKKLSGSIGIFKVGKQLFTHCGPTIIEMIHRHRGKVFLDLKFHDIPNTVARAVEEACKLNVFMLTIHALGGKKMMQEAVAASSTFARNSSSPSPLILAVTILTSLKPDDLKDIGINTSVEEAVSRLAILARQAGVNGVVASAQEAHIIRAACGNDLIIVTPGIRPQGTSRDDQKRAVTPHEALLAGSDYMVIGRPILEAHDPLKVVQEIAEELREGNN